jgi:hypothetical protein
MIESKVSEGISLYELFLKSKEVPTLIIKKWKLIFLFIILGAFFGYIVHTFSDSKFKAQTKFLIKEQKPLTLSSAFNSSLGFGFNLIEDSKIYSNNSFIELFQSRRIIEKSLLKTIYFNNEELTLADCYLKLYGLNTSTNSITKNFFPINSNRDLFSRNQDSILSLINDYIIDNNLSIDRIKNNQNIFNAEITSKNEQFSINLLSSIIETILEDYRLMKIRNLNLIKQRVDTLRIQTNKMLLNNRFNNSHTIKNNDTIIYNIDFDLNMQILNKLTEHLEIYKINLLSDTELIQFIDSTARPLLDQRISKVFLITIFSVFFGFICSFFIIVRNYLIINSKNKIGKIVN